MSYSVDANVLLYASDQSSDRHERARRFVETCAAGPEILCLTWPTLMAYLRIATHPRIFAAPLNPDEALGNVAALVELPHVRVVSEQDGFLDAYRRVRGRHAGARKPRAGRPCRGDPLSARRPDGLYERSRFQEVRIPDVRDPFS